MAYNSAPKVKKLNALEKVVKKNPKYDYVESTIDTGSSLTKYLKRVEEIKTNYRYQQNEIFKRMKISTFVQLICQVAEIDSLENESRNENDTSRTDTTLTKGANSLAYMSDRINENETPDLESARFSTLHGVIHGVGEQDAIKAYRTTRSTVPPPQSPKLKINNDQIMPYLLVDIRDRDEFNECHIITAYNYPAAMLSRSINNETAELLEFKNQPGKIIVIYDEDEKIGPKAAATMCERGYDNLFLLSGGLKLAVKKFPEGLITGTLPKLLLASLLKEQKGPRGRQYTEYTGPATKTSFDRTDIEKLNQYLEESLISGDTGSRLSRATTLSQSSSRNTVNSNVSNTSKATSIHSQPWKPV